MSFVGNLIGSLTGANQQAKAAQQAANLQSQDYQAGIDEAKRQFDVTQQNLAPFLQGGQKAVGSLGDLLGLNGNDAQSAAISGLMQSGQFGALAKQGETAILQNASATGGLRGGNTQAALAQFRPNLLSQLISDQMSRLGGLASLGAGTGSSLGQMGQNNTAQIAGLLGQQGAAQAGGVLAKGSVARTGIGDLFSILGMANGMGWKPF